MGFATLDETYTQYSVASEEQTRCGKHTRH